MACELALKDSIRNMSEVSYLLTFIPQEWGWAPGSAGSPEWPAYNSLGGEGYGSSEWPAYNSLGLT
jgi:hypothetical protein